MAKKNSIGIGIALLGGGGLLYYYMKNRDTVTPPVTPILPPPVPSGPSDLVPISAPVAVTLMPSTPLTATPLQMTPIVSTNAPGVTSGYANADGAGLSVADMQTILNWVGSLSQARQNQFYATAPLYTADEWKGLRNLVVIAWAQGQGQKASDVDFWNYWRVKYHIADGTIN